MRYRCTQALRERNPKIIAKVPLTSGRPYVLYPIGFRGSGVLGRIAFAGVPLVTDPRSSRKKHRRILASLCQSDRYRDTRGFTNNRYPCSCMSLFTRPLGEGSWILKRNAGTLRRPQERGISRVSATVCVSFRLKIEHVLRASVRAVFTGFSGEISAPATGGLSRQRASNRSRGVFFLRPLRLRPGHDSIGLKALRPKSEQTARLRREVVSLGCA